MKKIGWIVLLCVLSGEIAAQSKQTLNNDRVKDKIVALLNANDYIGIYQLADISFKKGITEDQFVNFLAGTQDYGKVIKTELLNTGKDGISKYKVYYKKKLLQLDLKATKSLHFDAFGLSYYSLPIVHTRKNFPTNNAMKTRLDSSVQKAVTPYMSNQNVSGLSVGVLQNGTMSTYHFGEVKKGANQLPTDETLYEIGSITKTFTGIILANTVKEGKVELNDDIRKYLEGSFPNLQYHDTPIQLVHLASHTSRLPSQPLIVNTREDPFDPEQVFSEKVLADILHNIKIDTLPGTKIEYSNFAVSLLGYILEKVHNVSYEQLLEKCIFIPARMTQSKISFTTADFKNYAQGYTVSGDTVNYWRNKLVEPAGGIRSTTKDMLLYIQAQLEAPKESAMWLSHQLTIGDNQRGKGLNWGISTTKKGYLVWSHDGGTYGFSSLCLIYPELNSGIILLTNNGNHNDEAFYQIGRSIYLDWVN
jgi:CubicO group peptidase (beta-lactamase class C family)